MQNLPGAECRGGWAKLVANNLVEVPASIFVRVGLFFEGLSSLARGLERKYRIKRKKSLGPLGLAVPDR